MLLACGRAWPRPTLACHVVQRTRAKAYRRNSSLRTPSVPSILAIDVEFAHFANAAGEHKHPAEVCIVDWDGHQVFHSYCHHCIDNAEWVGGVRLTHMQGALPLAEAASTVASIVAGSILIGHNLQNDLAALGIGHPSHLMRDTMRYACFQRRNGQAYSLKELAETLLGRHIQDDSKPHSAREDAAAVMLLYRRYIFADPGQILSEEELIQCYLRELNVS